MPQVIRTVFQSTLPLRGATGADPEAKVRSAISIHAPLTGSDLIMLYSGWRIGISIHAPLTGSDQVRMFETSPNRDFNPRSPYGERRPRCANTGDGRNFNPRSPYGERPVSVITVLPNPGHFNPRSPYGERHLSPAIIITGDTFQSTLPLRGATLIMLYSGWRIGISIHAPLTGSDQSGSRTV